MISGEEANTNVIVFGVTWLGLETMVYRTRGGEYINTQYMLQLAF